MVHLYNQIVQRASDICLLALKSHKPVFTVSPAVCNGVSPFDLVYFADILALSEICRFTTWLTADRTNCWHSVTADVVSNVAPDPADCFVVSAPAVFSDHFTHEYSF